MLTTVNGSEDLGARVERVTVQLSRVGQLEDALSDLWSSSVNLIQEEDHRLGASSLEPVGRVESSGAVHLIDDGQTNKVTFGHLASTTLNDGKTHRLSELVNHARFTNTVATPQQDGIPCVRYQRSHSVKGFEVNRHSSNNLPVLSEEPSPLSLLHVHYTINSRECQVKSSIFFLFLSLVSA